MRKSILVLAAATTLFGAHSAFAQETTEEPSPAKAFTGIRAEATIGLDQTSDDAFVDGSELTSMRVGGAVGYDVAIGKRVTIGVEAGIGWGVAGHTTTGPFPPTVPDSYRISGAHDADVSARLGYAAGSRTLVYAKAGWVDSVYRITSGGKDYYGDGTNGLRLGAGLEQKLGKHVYAKAEYRYTMYSEPGDRDPNRHQLLTGLGVRF